MYSVHGEVTHLYSTDENDLQNSVEIRVAPVIGSLRHDRKREFIFDDYENRGPDSFHTSGC